MKVVFFTSYSDNNLGVFNLSLKNHKDYCKQFGYDLVNFKQPYTPFIDAAKVYSFFQKDYDIAIIIGTDIIIKQNKPITDYVTNPGFTMCREIAGKKVFNGDFIIMTRNAITVSILNFLDQFQKKFRTAQDAILYCQIPVNESPYLQIAAPQSNLNLDYSPFDLSKYFSFHYHTIGQEPRVKNKVTAMKHDLEVSE